DDIAGLDAVKQEVKEKVLIPLEHPEIFEGFGIQHGGGMLLYGPPGTGKTMIAAAIANEIGAKFCSVKPSDLLQQGVGNTEKATRELFAQARSFPCAVVYFDEMDSLTPKTTRSQISKQLRSELLAQLQGMESYGKDTGNILFLIAATNKPWEIDSAFLRPGRFGTRIYVGLPDDDARRYMIEHALDKIRKEGIVEIDDGIDVDELVDRTNTYNGSDITNLLNKARTVAALRCVSSDEKNITAEDFEKAFETVHSTVQVDDIAKLNDWRNENF
ncbi:MAG: ATP-binding protein, partial [Clostridia bacterium]|nr:ATP-binding protein [Clostridia bacterium]